MKTMIAFLIVSVQLSLSAEMRSWTAVSGKTIEAEAVSKTDTTVTLRRSDRQEATVELTQLSEADREYIRSSNLPKTIRNDDPRLAPLIKKIMQSKPERGYTSEVGTQILRVSGRILQVTSGGILLESGWENRTLETYTDSRGIYHGGSNLMNRNLFIIGVPSSLVDGEKFQGVVYPAGTFRYKSVSGAEKTVHKYATSAELAAKTILEDLE